MDNLQSGIVAFKSGKREDARKYLIVAVKENPKDENAWGWLYQVANNDNERIECLKRVTAINPNNKKAIQLLNKLLAPLTSTPAIPNPPQQKQVNPPSSLLKQANSPSIATRKNNRKTLTYSVAVFVSLCLVCLVAALAINTAPPSQPTTESYISLLNCTGSGGIQSNGQHFNDFCLANGLLLNDPEKLEKTMREFCTNKQTEFCDINAWASIENVPESFPMTDSQVATQLAQYKKNDTTGYDCFILFKDGEQAYRSSGCSQ